ncbi:MAG: cyclic pyranopterin phosphate synthase MoaA, partial [Cyanobacteria bacterium K_DeepCast_35m_m1_288]|nr:cyclic pyranopterin phosphate synthase MoaA [Cyanobacteria bacterium K_DeepCast_35m_m1_288]
LRLIEYMDVGNRNGWSPADVVNASEMAERISAHWPLEEIGRDQHSTARRWRYRDGASGIAVVASVSQPFCGDCNRLRVTADGVAYTCLFAAASSGLDLKPWLQPSIDGMGLEEALRQLWHRRRDRYSEERQASATSREHAEMAYLGG